MRRTGLLVMVACLIAAFSYGGAVSELALFAYVLPTVLVLCVLGATLSLRFVPLVVLGPAATLAVAEIVNIASGSSNGPAARSSFVAGGCALYAAIAARSRWPSSFVVPTVGIVIGALALGAGGEVRVVAVATAMALLLTLASIERSQRRWASRPRRDVATLVTILIVGAGAAFAAVEQSVHHHRTPAVVGQTWVNAAIHPSWPDPFPGAIKPPQRAVAERPVQRHPHHKGHLQSHSHVLEYVLLGIAGGVALLIALVSLRLLVVSLAWRRLRRELHNQEAARSVAGAWTWARMRLAACRMPLGQHISPDVALLPGTLDDLPPAVNAPLRALAEHVTAAAFAPPALVAEAVTAWQLADEAADSAVGCLTRVRRIWLTLRKPAETHRDTFVATAGVRGLEGAVSS